MAILPRSTDDPSAQDKRERGAIKQFATRFKGIKRDMLALLNSIKYRKLVISSPLTTNAEVVKYEFDINELTYAAIGLEVDEIVDRWLEAVGTEAARQWLIQAFVTPAYQQGTGMAYSNLAVQSSSYKSTRESLADLLRSEPYRRRLGFIQARSFETMKNLGAQTKETMRLTLLDGMAQGLNPNEIAKQLEEATDLGAVRARRIARTEITTALRRARIEEAEQTTIDLGLNIRMMQFSALSPTTRLSHAKRHGKLFTFEEARAWMSTSPNMINCKCTFVEVLVGKDGKPLVAGIIARAEAIKAKSAFAEAA